jgi:hypothetical protein
MTPTLMFAIAFVAQSIALVITWVSASRSHKRLDHLENFIEMFTMATAHHVKRIDEEIKEKSNA